jgi:hypothetical protein
MWMVEGRMKDAYWRNGVLRLQFSYLAQLSAGLVWTALHRVKLRPDPSSRIAIFDATSTAIARTQARQHNPKHANPTLQSNGVNVSLSNQVRIRYEIVCSLANYLSQHGRTKKRALGPACECFRRG